MIYMSVHIIHYVLYLLIYFVSACLYIFDAVVLCISPRPLFFYCLVSFLLILSPLKKWRGSADHKQTHGSRRFHNFPNQKSRVLRKYIRKVTELYIYIFDFRSVKVYHIRRGKKCAEANFSAPIPVGAAGMFFGQSGCTTESGLLRGGVSFPPH